MLQSQSHMGSPGVAPSGASSKCAPSGASSADYWWDGSGGIGLAGGPSFTSGYIYDTWGSKIES